MVRTWQELAAIIKSEKKPMRDYCVVDVRDDDWYGGNIKGAHNEPSSGFLVRVHELVTKTKDVPLVVFHCALSQVRYVRKRCVLSPHLTSTFLEGPKPLE